MKSTVYDILRVGEKASSDEISAAYQERRLQLVNVGDQESQNELKLVQHAFEILSDKNQRTRYDQRQYSQGNAGKDQSMLSTNMGNSGIAWLFIIAILIGAGCFFYQKVLSSKQPSNSEKRVSQVQIEPPAPPAAEPQPQPQQTAQQTETRLEEKSPVAESVSLPQIVDSAAPVPPSSPAQESSMANQPQSVTLTKAININDVGAVPYLTDGGRARYREFLALPSPRAFIVCQDRTFSITHGKGTHAEIAKGQKEGCELYALDNEVVWKGK